jgi:chromatin remodeling complex protein RSC6
MAEKLASALGLLREVATTLKQHGKEHNKAIKQLSKGSRRQSAGTRVASGFAKPTQLSPELTAFLGLDPDTRLARTEVTKAINRYVKENELYDASNKRIILPDDKLQRLLFTQETLPEGVPLSFFNLQRYLKQHFVPAQVQAEAA